MPGSASRGRNGTGPLGVVATLNLAAAASAHLVVLARVGANYRSDAYFAALIVPQLLTGVLYGAILNATVPDLARHEQRRGTLARSLLAGVLGVGMVVVLVVGVAAPVLARVVAPGFDAPAADLTAYLLRIGLVGALAACGGSVATAWFQSRDRFLGPELAGLVGNVAFLVGAVALVHGDGVATAAWLNVASYVLPLVLLGVPLAARPGRLDPRSALADLGSRIRPLATLGAVQQVEPVVERALLSLGPAGGVALYSLARQFLTAGLLVLDKAVAAPLLPALARLRSGPRFADRLRRGRREIVVLALAAVSLTAAAGPVLIGPMADRSSLTVADLTSVWHLALIFGGGLVFGASFAVDARGCYARGDRSTPTRLALLAVPVGVLLRVGGFALAGVAGVAMAVSTQWAGLALALILVAGAPRRGLGRRPGR